ncbi:MAG: hypothetical protein QXZ28_00865 [Candidatus Methanomethylicaceae archaeon]
MITRVVFASIAVERSLKWKQGRASSFYGEEISLLDIWPSFTEGSGG